MPSSPDYDRDYQEEYKNYQGKPEQVKNREMRNKAHKLLEEVMGRPVKPGYDVDHKKPLSKGGDNVLKNLREVPAGKNRSFGRTKDGEMA